MICKLCKKKEVTDPNPKIHICSLCRLEIELSFQYYIGKVEVIKEEYEKQINKHFKRIKNV